MSKPISSQPPNSEAVLVLAVAQHLGGEAVPRAMEGQAVEVLHGLCHRGDIFIPQPAQTDFLNKGRASRGAAHVFAGFS